MYIFHAPVWNAQEHHRSDGVGDEEAVSLQLQHLCTESCKGVARLMRLIGILACDAEASNRRNDRLLPLRGEAHLALVKHRRHVAIALCRSLPPLRGHKNSISKLQAIHGFSGTFHSISEIQAIHSFSGAHMDANARVSTHPVVQIPPRLQSHARLLMYRHEKSNSLDSHS